MKKILYVQHSDVLQSQIIQVNSTLREAFPGAQIDFASSPEDVPIHSRYDAVIAPTVFWLPKLLSRIDSSPIIHFQSAGVEKIWDMDFDKSRYRMTKSSGVHAVPMSEFAIGAMLFFAKSFDLFVEQSRAREWKRKWLDELNGKRLVVLGLGAVGMAVTERSIALGMRVSGTRESGQSIENVGKVTTLAEADLLLREADYIVIALPLTAATENLVGPEFLGKLKSGAVLIDISRGGIVVGDAVKTALESGKLRGAALDVFETEPLEPESDLWGRSNVLLTPHVAGTTPHYLARVLSSFIQSINSIENGQLPPNLVDVSRGY